MRKSIGNTSKYLLSLLCYSMGDIVGKIMNIWPCQFLHPYPLYNFLMITSVKLDVNYKVWKVEEES